MTKKDYIAMARALLAEKPGAHWDPNKMVQWRLDVRAVADVFSRDNGRFDYARFYAACGLEAD